MTPIQFNALSPNKKQFIMNNSGPQYIGKRRAANCTVFLYSYHNFFIEVWESTTEEEEISTPMAFAATSKAADIWVNDIKLALI